MYFSTAKTKLVKVYGTNNLKFFLNIKKQSNLLVFKNTITKDIISLKQIIKIST